jgi:hypothetical protein
MLVSSGGGSVSISVANFVVPLSSAVISTEVGAATGNVGTLKSTDVAPVGTTTTAGGTTDALTLDKLTCCPPEKAGPEIVIIPCVVVPLGMVLGVSVNPVMVSGVTGVIFSVVCKVTLSVAPTATVTGEPTCGVLSLNVTMLAPAGTVTVRGVGTLKLLLDIPTSVPPVGAAALMVTVTFVDWPPGTVVGERVILISEGGFGLGAGATGVLPQPASSAAINTIREKNA